MYSSKSPPLHTRLCGSLTCWSIMALRQSDIFSVSTIVHGHALRKWVIPFSFYGRPPLLIYFTSVWKFVSVAVIPVVLLCNTCQPLPSQQCGRYFCLSLRTFYSSSRIFLEAVWFFVCSARGVFTVHTLSSVPFASDAVTSLPATSSSQDSSGCFE